MCVARVGRRATGFRRTLIGEATTKRRGGPLGHRGVETMGTSGTLGTSGTETSSRGRNVVRGRKRRLRGRGSLSSAARVCVTARDGATPRLAGVGFRTGSFGLSGARNGEASGDDGAAGTLRAGIGERSVRIRGRTAQAVRLDGPRARAGRGRDPRAVVDTETGGDRRGMPQGRARARAKRDVLSRSARSCASTVARSERGRRACAGGVTEGRGVGAGVSADGSRRGERFSERSARAKNVGEAKRRDARARARRRGRRRGACTRRDASKRSRSESTNALALRERCAVAPRWRCASGSRTDGPATRRARIAGIKQFLLRASEANPASSRPPSDGISGRNAAACRPKAPARRRGRRGRRDAVRDDLETARALLPGRRSGGAPPTAGRVASNPSSRANERTVLLAARRSF